jgi:hypothetical protein
MSEYDLLAVWFRVADWDAYDLSKDGDEGILLKPLGEYSKAATFLVRSAFSSKNYRHRKLAASLAGWIQQPPLDLLTHLFQQESERDRRLAKDDFDRLNSQSIVEDIVYSASFWARRKATRAAELQPLRDVVERTIAGEYWDNARIALTTLCRHEAPGYRELMARFQKFAASATVDHPSRPSLTQELEFAQNLAANNPETLLAIESSLDHKEEAAEGSLDENSRAAVDELVEAAKLFEGAAS